jgi:hypothetical protein
MKNNVAICIGGLTYRDSEPLVERLKNRFPNYDFFFGVWKDRETDLSKKLNAFVYEEHTPDYHPYLDIDINTWPTKLKTIIEKMHRKMAENGEMKLIAKAPHQTKQILMHSYMLKSIPEHYDMIIRARWDLLIKNESIPFEKFIEESKEQNKAIGFSANQAPTRGSCWDANIPNWSRWWEGFLMDLMIIHPRKIFNHEKMWELHNSKQLLAAEFGWYQVLSDGNHNCYFADMNMTSRDGYR